MVKYYKTAFQKEIYMFYVFKVLIKSLKPQITSQNVALRDINIALWVISLFIVMKFFVFFFKCKKCPI